jgi:hypothetical protein
VPGPEVVVETISFSKLLMTSLTTAGPFVLAGIAGFVKLRTQFNMTEVHNAEAHDEIKQRLDTSNGHVAAAQQAIADARTEIEGIKSTCTERGRLEKEIRAELRAELEGLKQ